MFTDLGVYSGEAQQGIFLMLSVSCLIVHNKHTTAWCSLVPLLLFIYQINTIQENPLDLLLYNI